jgi:mannan endo-1,4-beta-mannosidase
MFQAKHHNNQGLLTTISRNYGDYCKKRNIPKSDFWTNEIVREDFKAYIHGWLNHTNQYTGIKIKDDPALFLIEIGNELGNIRQEPNGQYTTIPTEEWIIDIANFIKHEDNNHLLLNGCDECLGSKTTNDFQIDAIDVYSSHFYSKNYRRLNRDSQAAAHVGKPYLIGEYSGHFDDDWFHEIESNSHVKGSIFWNLYPLGTLHSDGQTLYYGDPESEAALLRIANHHRRMCGLPPIASLP